MKPLWCLLLILAGAVPGAAGGLAAYTIETVAGSIGMGDGGPAVLAQIGAIQGLTVDRFGNLYLSDTDHHRIRKISAAGVISTLAGTGTAGFSGDGGPATSAEFNLPYGLAVDLAGSVYVADLGNHRVRRIDADGTVRTLAGTGTNGSSGDGGPAVAAQLAAPRNLVLDPPGNLYVADFEGHRIRRISPDGRISTVAGTGVAGLGGDGGPATSAQLNCPAGLAMDRFGALYIADSQNGRVRKFLAGGAISTVVGGSGGFATPRAVALDHAGTLYVADSAGTWVNAYGSDGKPVRFAGTGARNFDGDGGPAAQAALRNVLDLAVDLDGNLFLADDVRVRKVNLPGIIQTVAGDSYVRAVGDGGPAIDASLHQPSAVTLDTFGNLWIADTGTQRIRQVLPSQKIATVAGIGVPVWGVTGEMLPAASAGLNFPMGVAVDPGGSLYLADTFNHVVRKIGLDQKIATVVGTGEGGIGPDLQPPSQVPLRAPRAVCTSRAGTLFVVDTSNHRVLRIAPGALAETLAGNGSPGDTGDGGKATSAQLNQPGACAVDSFDNLFLADTLNHRIRKINSAGAISTVAGTGEAGYSGDEGPAQKARLQAPFGIAVDDSGNVYIADTGNHRVRQVTPDGIIHTIAGQGLMGFRGDGGLATAALLHSPGGLCLDGSGMLYFADTGNDRVRRLVPGGLAMSAPLADPPALTVLNAASRRTGPIAPGEILALLGIGLGPETAAGATFDTGLLPVELGGTEVRFGGVAAPLFYAQSGQVSVQVPYEVAGKANIRVEVRYLGSTAGAIELAVAATAPALYPVALNEDGWANALSRPASAGATLTFYATGEGLSDGSNISGQTARAPYPSPQAPLDLKVAGVAAEILSARSAPGVVGILEIKARIPSLSASPGTAALQFTVGGLAAPEIPIFLK